MTNAEWQAELLRLKLVRLNRNFLANSPHAFLRGRDSWPNQQPERFAGELSDARSLGITAVGIDAPTFEEFVKSGRRFNWAVSLDGSLRVSITMAATAAGPVHISHAILSPSGGPVLAAREGVFGGYLSNTTGHYKNEEFVLQPVLDAFARIGIVFPQ